MWLLYIVPKNLLSFLVGWIVRLKLPFGWGAWSVKWFIRYYQINMNEAESSDYLSIGQLFTRKLKEGARPLDSSFYVHPADAKITNCGVIEKNILFQAKGKQYQTSDLLKDSSRSREGWSYLTYYLCPTDYHRVHSPVSGEILECTYIPGRLWPVNPWSVNHISQLFSVNERVVIKIKTEKGIVFAAMVGATNVGRISLGFEPSIVTNTQLFKKEKLCSYNPPQPIVKGSELGVFHMGSTVIVIAEKGIINDVQNFKERKVLVNSF